MKIFINDLLKLNNLDFMIDIHLYGTTHEWEPVDSPMIRKIKKVYIKEEKGKQWLYWKWHENSTEDIQRGYSDCGYSAIDLNDENINKLYFNIGE